MVRKRKRLFGKIDQADHEENASPDAKTVFEKLTDQLIDETIGREGSMRRRFERLTMGYDVDKNPIGVDDAKRILLALVGNAVERRKVFAGRIEKSVVEEGLFKRYYASLQEINDLTIKADEMMQRMKRARGQYIYEAEIYRKLTGFSYVNEVMPTADELNEARKKLDSGFEADDMKSDVWSKLDYEGGEMDEPIFEDDSEIE